MFFNHGDIIMLYNAIDLTQIGLTTGLVVKKYKKKRKWIKINSFRKTTILLWPPCVKPTFWPCDVIRRPTWVNNGSSNGFLPEGAKSLPEPMLT